MGLFSRKEEKEKDTIPNLPDLPPLPPIQDLEEEPEELPKLPSFPKSDLGEKFSQNTIKKAINGKREEEKEIFEEDDFATRKRQTILESPQRDFQYRGPSRFIQEKFIEEREETEKKTPNYEPQKRIIINKSPPEGFEEAEKKIKEAEPVFVRIDKFEDSRRIFEKAKEQISEIERTLNKIKSVKQEEDNELESWEQEILNIKDKISKVEKDIFSKV